MATQRSNRLLSFTKRNWFGLRELMARVEHWRKGTTLSLCLNWERVSYTFSFVSFLSVHSWRLTKREHPESWTLYHWWKFTLVINRRPEWK